MSITEQELKLKSYISKVNSTECGNCGSVLFKQVVLIKEIPKLLVGSPEDVIIPIAVYRCDDCGDILRDLLPKDVKVFNDDAPEEKKGGLILDK